MDEQLRHDVTQVIERATKRHGVIDKIQGVGGGCISNASGITLSDGRRFFVKSNPSPLPGMFEQEAVGLNALSGVGAIRVPRALGTGGGVSDDARPRGTPFIVMEWIETGRPGNGFAEGFGARFAALHRASTAEHFGFEADNYIGSTPQPNGWGADWVVFWRDQRLGYQLDLARKLGHGDNELHRLGVRLMDRLDDVIGFPDEPPCLLHGDLWSGNYLVDDRGDPVLIDPAAYYGRREADLAMAMLFGGFSQRFYDAYHEAWPLADESERRLDAYKLYHLLNHLNLFGSSYLSQCLSLLRNLV